MPLLPHQKLRARASSALARRFLLSNNGLTRSSTFAAVPPPCHHQDAHLSPMSKIEEVEVKSDTMEPVYHVSLRTGGCKDEEMEEDLKPAVLAAYGNDRADSYNLPPRTPCGIKTTIENSPFAFGAAPVSPSSPHFPLAPSGTRFASCPAPCCNEEEQDAGDSNVHDAHAAEPKNEVLDGVYAGREFKDAEAFKQFALEIYDECREKGCAAPEWHKKSENGTVYLWCRNNRSVSKRSDGVLRKCRWALSAKPIVAGGQQLRLVGINLAHNAQFCIGSYGRYQPGGKSPKSSMKDCASSSKNAKKSSKRVKARVGRIVDDAGQSNCKKIRSRAPSPSPSSSSPIENCRTLTANAIEDKLQMDLGALLVLGLTYSDAKIEAAQLLEDLGGMNGI